MMKKASKPNALLIELVIVLLFFSLSAVIILQLFVAAHDKIVRSVVGSEAALMAEDVTERFYQSPLSFSAFFEAEGWEGEETAYMLSTKAAGDRPVRFLAAGASTEKDAGTLDELMLTVYDGENAIFEIPIARYRGMEALP